MRLVLFGGERLRTTARPDEVEQRLASVFAQDRSSARSLGRGFVGQVSLGELKAQDVGGVGGLRPIRPVFTGKIVPTASGVEVRLHLRLPRPGAVFMWLWFGFFVWMAWDGYRQAVTGGWEPHAADLRRGIEEPRAILAIASAFLVGGYTALLVQFWAEVRRGFDLLRAAVGADGDPVEGSPGPPA